MFPKQNIFYINLSYQKSILLNRKRSVRKYTPFACHFLQYANISYIINAIKRYKGDAECT